MDFLPIFDAVQIFEQKRRRRIDTESLFIANQNAECMLCWPDTAAKGTHSFRNTGKCKIF